MLGRSRRGSEGGQWDRSGGESAGAKRSRFRVCESRSEPNCGTKLLNPLRDTASDVRAPSRVRSAHRTGSGRGRTGAGSTGGAGRRNRVRQITERTHLIAEIVAGATGYGIGWWRTGPSPGGVPRGAPGRDRPGGRSGWGRSGSGLKVRSERIARRVRWFAERTHFRGERSSLASRYGFGHWRTGPRPDGVPGGIPGRIGAREVAISSGGLGAMSGAVAASP
jgi:hypothetical protein